MHSHCRQRNDNMEIQIINYVCIAPWYLMVDGLDECDLKVEQTLLDLVLLHSSTLSAWALASKN